MWSALIWIALIAAVIIWAFQSNNKKQKSHVSYEDWPPKKNASHRSQATNESWKDEPATDKQLDYIESLGGKIPARGLTKGEASDRISKLQPIDESDAEVLRYFKVSTRGVTKDAAARAVIALMNDEAHKKAWSERPPSLATKEFFRFAKLKVPSSIGYDEAENLKLETLKSWETEEASRRSDWMNYERLLEEIYDPDAREGWGIKKPPITLVRSCIAEFIDQGASYESLADEPDELIDRMLELKPELEAS